MTDIWCHCQNTNLLIFSVNKTLASIKEKSVEKNSSITLPNFPLQLVQSVQSFKQSVLFFKCKSVSFFIPGISAEPRFLNKLSSQHKGLNLESLEILLGMSLCLSISFFFCLLLFSLDWIHAFLYWRRSNIRHRRSGKVFSPPWFR